MESNDGITTVAQCIAFLHTVNMNRDTSLLLLRRLLADRTITQTAIGDALDIHPSQVSRICSGHFKRMSGNALKVCKFAYQIDARKLANHSARGLANGLEGKLAQLLAANPEAAVAVGGLIDALLDAPRTGTSALGA